MFFKSIYLENFRMYKGPEEFDLSCDDKKINIIQGNNDAGKTTMLNAITWCLYDEEKNKLSQELYNSNTFENTSIGDMIDVKVVITMEDPKSRVLTITRSHKYKKINNNSCSLIDEEFTIFRDDGKNDEIISFPNDYINTHMPGSLKDYFLFDGELLAQFFKKDNGNIKKDVFRLSQLNLLKKISTHIKARKSEFIDEKSEKQPQLANLLKKIFDNEENIKQYEEAEKEKEKSIKKYKSKIKELENDWEKKVGNKKDNDPLKYYNEKNKLLKRKTEIINNIKTAETNYKKNLFDNFSKIWGYSILKNMELKGEELKEEGFIPAQYRKSFLEFLMSRNKCICGRSLIEGTPEYSEVEELFNKTDEITDISELINKLLGKVESLTSNYPEDFIELDNSWDQEIIDLEENLEEVNQQINENEVLINTNITEEEIRKLKYEIEYYERQLKQTEMELNSIQTKKEMADKNLKIAKREYNKLKTQFGDLDELDKKIEFCDKVRDASDELYNALVVDIHDKLQKLTTDEFSIYHWKNSYAGIDIDDDFNVKFIRKDGSRVLATDPSAGTQLTLALSFITALNNLAGFNLPIVIDTPLGRLDNDIRYNLGKFLPEYTKNIQVLLLTTGNEYSGDFKKNIASHVGKTYKLNVVDLDDQEITKVIPAD